LELNDVGFLRQADEIKQYAEISRLFLKPTNLYRRANIDFEPPLGAIIPAKLLGITVISGPWPDSHGLRFTRECR
jgi:hypothetical protein